MKKKTNLTKFVLQFLLIRFFHKIQFEYQQHHTFVEEHILYSEVNYQIQDSRINILIIDNIKNKFTNSRNRLATSETGKRPFDRNILGFHIAA